MKSCAKINLSFAFSGSNSNSHCGMVELDDGRHFLPPYSATSAKIIDWQTLTMVTPTGSYPGNGAFSDAINRKGKAYMCPYNHNRAMQFNPCTESVETLPEVFPGNYAYNGLVDMEEYGLFHVPHNALYAKVMKHDDTYFNTGTFPGGYAFAGGIWHSTRKVICVPHKSKRVAIYDPETDITTFGAELFSGLESFVGGVEIPGSGGLVFFSPHKSSQAYIYDLATDTATAVTGSFGTAGVANYNGCILLADNRIAIIPFQATKMKIYDHANGTLTEPPGTYSGSGAFRGACKLPNGRIMPVPFNASAGVLVCS